MAKRRFFIAAMLLGLLVLAYVDRVALSVAGPLLLARFQLSHATLGYLFSAFAWSYVLFILPAGALVDRFGFKLVGAAGLLLWSLATILTGLSPDFTVLIAARLLLGIGETVCFPVAGRVIREWFPLEERGLVSIIFNSGSSAGTALGAPLTAWLITVTTWNTAFVLLGLAGFVLVLAWMVWFGRPETARWLSPGERDHILSSRQIHAPKRSMAAPQGYLALLSHSSMWGLMLTQGCMVYTGYLFFSWIPSYLQTTLKLSTMDMGLYTAIPFCAAIVLGLVGAWVSDRVQVRHAPGTRRLFVAGFMSLGLVMLLARYMDSSWSLLVVLSAVTLANNMTTGLNLALANDLVENPRDSSRVVGLMVLGGNVFGLLGPIVTGHVVDATGRYDLAFGIAACLLVLGAAACLILSRRRIAAQATAAPAIA